MGLQGEQHTSRGDLMRRLREQDKRIRALETARRLEAASIGSGGLTIKGGFVRILDDDGNETARFATDGLTLEGFLSVIGNIQVRGDAGRIEILDADGDVQLTLGTDGLTLEGLLEVLGAIEVTGSLSVEGPGALIRWVDIDENERFRFGNFDVLGLDVIRLAYTDAAGNERAVLGELVFEDGTFAGHGISLKNSDESTIFSVNGGDVSILPRDGDTLTIFVDTETSGVRKLGQVTAGPEDSAGTGFRTLRLPN